MSFICKNCNNYVTSLNRQRRCPKCGCHVLKCFDLAKKSIYRNNYFNHMDFDIEKITGDLIELIMPAVIDQTCLEKVIDHVKDYFFGKYERILGTCPFVRDYHKDRNGQYDKNYKTLTFHLQSRLERQLVIFNGVEKIRSQELASAVNMHNARMSAPVQGLGFGIITNDFISAATYTALARRNYKNQIARREAVATRELTAALAQFKSSNNSMSESDMYAIFDAVNETVKQIDMWLTTYKFITEHTDFYCDEAKYNLHKCINGIDIYNMISSSVSESGFYCNEQEQCASTSEAKLFDELETLGYIYRVRGYYFSTTKFENETLREIYFREHPKQKDALDQEKSEEADRLYAEAEDLLSNNRYYEAAIAFAQIPKSKDAAIRSLNIWQEHLEMFDMINVEEDFLWAIRDNGTIACTEKDFRNDKDSKLFIDSVRSILNVYKACWYKDQFHMLDINGDLHSSKNSIPPVSYDPEANRIVGDCTIWKYLTDIISNSDSIVGLRRDGRVVVSGDSSYGLRDILEWKDITKMKCRNFNTYIGIRSDGSIAVAGDEEYAKLPYQSWRNIIDVAVYSEGLIGLTADGTVKAIPVRGVKKDMFKELETWKNIRRVRCDSSYCLGFTYTGTLRFLGDECFSSEKAFFEAQENVIDALYGVMGSEYSDGCLVLHSDGTVSTKNIPLDFSEWKDIVSIGSGDKFVYGVKSNGRLVFAAREKTALKSVNKIKNWILFNDINAHIRNKDEIIKENSQASLIESKQKLEETYKALEQTKGIFALKKKRELKFQISVLERRLYPDTHKMYQGRTETLKFNR